MSLPLLAPASSGSSTDDFTRDPRGFTWIDRGVMAIGGGGLDDAQVDAAYDLGFRSIVNFRAEHEDPEERIRALGMTYLHIPVHAVDLNATHLREFVEFVRAERDAGRPVYAHCQNGWHRAVAFATAWLMAEHGMDYEDAKTSVRELRGHHSVMRAPAAVLAYQAELRQQPALTVLLTAERDRPADSGVMPVIVEVLDGQGRPAAGARVRVWSEESGLRYETTADGNGLHTFRYEAPAGSPMDHLYAMAWLEDHMPGAANVVVRYHDAPGPRAPLSVDARYAPDGVEVHYSARGEMPESVRILAHGSGDAFASDVTSAGAAFLPLDHGWRPIEVRVVTWGRPDTVITVEPPPVTPPPVPRPDPTPAWEPPVDAGRPPEAPPSGAAGADAATSDAGRWHASAGVVAVALALAAIGIACGGMLRGRASR